MIRVLTGRGWRFNPRLLAELRTGLSRPGGPPPAIVDVLGLEIDGVDLFAGVAEDRIVEVTADLATAVSRLASGYRRAEVPCSGGALELLLERRDAQVSLTLVRARRPSAVVLEALELELSALAVAVLKSGRELLDDLRRIDPRLLELAAAQRLRRALAGALGKTPRAQPKREAIQGPARPLTAKGTSGASSFRLELDDSEGLLESFAGGRPDLLSLLVPGKLTLEPGGTLPPWSSQTEPFLRLRDLVQSALEAVRAIEHGDPEHELALDGEVALELRLAEGAPPVAAYMRETARGREHGKAGFAPLAPAPLLSAIFEAALAYGTLAIHQNARQAQNVPLVTLLGEAREGLARTKELAVAAAIEPAAPTSPEPGKPRRGSAAEPRLLPGRPKVLSYREAWRSRSVGPARRLTALPRAVLVEGEGGVACLAAEDGSVAWSVEGEQVKAIVGRRAGVVVADARRLRGRITSGGVGWQVPLERAVDGLALASEGEMEICAIASGTEVTAYATARGATLWRFAPPGVQRLLVAGQGSRLLLWTNDERLYCVAPVLGRLLWRTRGRPLPSAGNERGPEILVQTKARGLGVVNLRTGHSVPLPVDLDRAGASARLGRLTLLSGLVNGEGVVVATRPTADGGGELAWRWADDDRLGAGVPLFCAVPGGVLVRSARSLSRLDALGKVLWSHPLSEDSHDGIAPLYRRGIAFAAGDAGVFAFDCETGAVLCQLDADPPLSALALDSQLGVYLAGDAGPVRALRVARFLSVV